MLVIASGGDFRAEICSIGSILFFARKIYSNHMALSGGFVECDARDLIYSRFA